MFHILQASLRFGPQDPVILLEVELFDSIAPGIVEGLSSHPPTVRMSPKEI